MGVRHLIEIRQFMKENHDKNYSKANLRRALNHNAVIMDNNIYFLLNIEKTIEIVKTKSKVTRYKWIK